MNKLLQTTIGKLRLVGFAEAISWLLLLGFAMPLKYIWHLPLAVKYVGWIHGILFMSYMLLAFLSKLEYHWKFTKLLLAFVLAFLPFGTLIFDAQLKNDSHNTTKHTANKEQ